MFAYAATGDLIALNLASGKPEWTYALNAAPWESPAVMDDRVLGGSNEGSVYAFDSQTGRVQWQQRLGAAVATSIRATASDIYAGTADGKVHRLGFSIGDVRSSLNIDSALKLTSAPALTKDAVLLLLADKDANYREVVSLDGVGGRPVAPEGAGSVDHQPGFRHAADGFRRQSFWRGDRVLCGGRILGLVPQAGERADSVYRRNR